MSPPKWLKALEDENAKLKRLLADAMLDNAGQKELIAAAGVHDDRHLPGDGVA